MLVIRLTDCIVGLKKSLYIYFSYSDKTRLSKLKATDFTEFAVYQQTKKQNDILPTQSNGSL